jgi:hypothetical protein
MLWKPWNLHAEKNFSGPQHRENLSSAFDIWLEQIQYFQMALTVIKLWPHCVYLENKRWILCIFCIGTFSILRDGEVSVIAVAGSKISASTCMQLFCKTLQPWSYLLLTSWCSCHCVNQCQCKNVKVIDSAIKTKLRKRYLNVHLQK